MVRERGGSEGGDGEGAHSKVSQAHEPLSVLK